MTVTEAFILRYGKPFPRTDLPGMHYCEGFAGPDNLAAWHALDGAVVDPIPGVRYVGVALRGPLQHWRRPALSFPFADPVTEFQSLLA